MMAESHPLAPVEAAALLRASADAVQAEVNALPATVAAWHPAPGEWCVKECLGHMIEAERRGFAGRIRRILDEPGRFETSWDQVEVQRARHDCDSEVASILEEFLQLREDSAKLVRGIAETQLDLACNHATVGELSVRDLLHEWPHHDRNHIRQMQANVQAYLWPSMGNAQKFSAE